MQNGFGIIYSNRLENLADALIQWCADYPLANPLEQEVVLVQSNGMADWLKLRQAETQGISGSTRYPMPASYLWELYQQVLDPAQLLQISPYQKGSLQWRIFRLLPTLISKDEFERPREFLCPQGELDVARQFQLSRRLADLYDQYQLYRSEWLLSWEQGEDCLLLNDNGQQQPKNKAFKTDEPWQKLLWKALVDDIGPSHISRAHLHKQFIDKIATIDKSTLPKRIILFGINSLPAQLLETLYLLSHHCQLMMFVLTPSEAFWGDRYNGGHPLLDAWGARGRDFIRLLQEEYDRQPPENQIKLFDASIYSDSNEPAQSLPQLIQNSLLNNAPPEQTELPTLLKSNPGLAFHPAYSRQREVEVLHDQILSMLASDTSLTYRDFIVMVPNIEQYAPHIEAVFSRYSRFIGEGSNKKRDARRLDYAISDRNPLTDNTLFQALDYLLSLPQSRLTLSEVFTLLEQPAICQRFGINETDIEQLMQWAEQAKVRWGFDSTHKAALLNADNNTSWQNNTWQQGLDRLLAGYCVGNAAVWGNDDLPLIDGLAIDEVTANQGDLLGRFYLLVNQLRLWQDGSRLNQPHSPANGSNSWKAIFTQLLDNFLAATDDTDEFILQKMHEAIDSWLDDCASANFNDALPLSQARAAWLDKIESSGMSQKLKFNGITFCTLMPMRALPFKQVFLLGMNDGDYPREQIAPDFDLMQHHYLAGDRDRRGDDQYLFLEALLSARQSLTISWVGKSIVDGADKEPSVLVNQLRDYVDDCWFIADTNSKPVSSYLTQQWPLAPFSRTYFEKDNAQRTYANEWLQLYQSDQTPTQNQLELPSEISALSFAHFATLIKQPVEAFFRYGLGVYLLTPENGTEDDEPFEMDGLEKWKLRNAFMQQDANDNRTALLIRSGGLPLGAFATSYIEKAASEADNIRERIEETVGNATPFEQPQNIIIELDAQGIKATLEGCLFDCWQGKRTLQIFSSASNIGTHKSPRIDKLAVPYIAHLAACAAAICPTTYFIGLSASLTLKPLSNVEAQKQLNTLFAIYLEAIKQPLPLTPMAALAYLSKQEETDSLGSFEQAASSAYYSGQYKQGDDSNAYVSRAFEHFDDIWRGSGSDFMHYAQQLYSPILDALVKQEESDDE